MMYMFGCLDLCNALWSLYKAELWPYSVMHDPSGTESRIL